MMLTSMFVTHIFVVVWAAIAAMQAFWPNKNKLLGGIAIAVVVVQLLAALADTET